MADGTGGDGALGRPRGLQASMGARRFGRWNARGTWTLAERECRRFLNVWSQTLAGPLVTAGLFLVVFGLAFGAARPDVMGVPFLHFLAPGIITMTVIQNAFANTSSSLLVAKVQGNIVDTLMPPLSAGELTAGYLAGGVARGLIVAAAMMLAVRLALGLGVAHWGWALAFTLVGSALMAGLGVLAAIVAQKFDQMAAITNFVVVPLSFLSGTFYSTEALPPVMRTITHWNPFFYLIDGVRHGVLGVSDADPRLGMAVCLGATAVVLAGCWQAFRTGWRLKP